MTIGPSVVPLLVRLELTADQQRQLRDQAGYILTAIPYESAARAIRTRFGGITLRVPRGVFVPSRSTERALDITLAAAANWTNPTIVDVGTGCGAVALAAAHRFPSATVFGTDIAETALRSARRNRARLGLSNVRFARGSLLSPIPRSLRQNVAVIVANVPYVPPSFGDALAGVFPADSAMGVGSDGLGLVRELATSAKDYLAPGGRLVLQVVESQWVSLRAHLEAFGYVAADASGLGAGGPITVYATWPGSLAPIGRELVVHDRPTEIHDQFTQAGDVAEGREHA